MIEPHAVPVSVPGFTWAAAGSWGTLIVVLGALGLFLNRSGPFTTKIVELILSRADKLRGEKREDDVSNTARIASLEERMSRIGGALVFCVNAVTTSIDGLESDDPAVREQAARRSRESIALAASTLGAEDPFYKALAHLAAAPAVTTRPRGK